MQGLTRVLLIAMNCRAGTSRRALVRLVATAAVGFSSHYKQLGLALNRERNRVNLASPGITSVRFGSGSCRSRAVRIQLTAPVCGWCWREWCRELWGKARLTARSLLFHCWQAVRKYEHKQLHLPGTNEE